jgi:hypothetical protein
MILVHQFEGHYVALFQKFLTCLGMIVGIDLVLINQQSVGKRSLHLMDTVNAKKRWTTIYWRFNKFFKKCYIVTRYLTSAHHF